MRKDEWALSAPILDEPGLLRFLDEIRANGLRLVFTNGCFDLIHPGHVAYLMEARALGDRLLVGLNSDDSVRRLKGAGRPLIPERGRGEILAALRCVDAVVVFGEDTPRELILRVRPKFLVKGGDYRPEEVVGATDLPGWGGELRILPFREGFATSKIIAAVRNPKGNNPLSA
jgi:D-beta-D-heptose 7-phosphate kinase/D-beta-D-heptose 1-phosphate adenosyltransferase